MPDPPDDARGNPLARARRPVSTTRACCPPEPVSTSSRSFGPLGVGGFGIVYLALDHSLLRQVALKEFMPGELAARGPGGIVGPRSPDCAEQFERSLESFFNEARLLAPFNHPALVRVHRFWKANGTAYMAMQYCPGVTLDAGAPHDARPARRGLAARRRRADPRRARAAASRRRVPPRHLARQHPAAAQRPADPARLRLGAPCRRRGIEIADRRAQAQLRADRAVRRLGRHGARPVDRSLCARGDGALHAHRRGADAGRDARRRRCADAARGRGRLRHFRAWARGSSRPSTGPRRSRRRIGRKASRRCARPSATMRSAARRRRPPAAHEAASGDARSSRWALAALGVLGVACLDARRDVGDVFARPRRRRRACRRRRRTSPPAPMAAIAPGRADGRSAGAAAGERSTRRRLSAPVAPEAAPTMAARSEARGGVHARATTRAAEATARCREVDGTDRADIAARRRRPRVGSRSPAEVCAGRNFIATRDLRQPAMPGARLAPAPRVRRRAKDRGAAAAPDGSLRAAASSAGRREACRGIIARHRPSRPARWPRAARPAAPTPGSRRRGERPTPPRRR